MQQLSQTYNTLYSAGAPKEYQAVIAGVVYTDQKIASAYSGAAADATAATVGNCVAKSLNLVLRNPGEIPRMAKIQMRYRLNNGTTHSEWIPKGTFFIDTRSEGNGVLTLVAYDAMLKCDQDFITTGSQGSWPKTDIQVVNEICSRIGVTLDSRTRNILTMGYRIPYPGYGDDAYSMREVLGFIGAAYAGNWVITDQDTLRLLILGDIPPETNYLITENEEFILIGGYRILV